MSGAEGDGLTLQIVPLIRPVVPNDGNSTFDLPIEGTAMRFYGSGFVEGDTRITLGGIEIDDNSASVLVKFMSPIWVSVSPRSILMGSARIVTIWRSRKLKM